MPRILASLVLLCFASVASAAGPYEVSIDHGLAPRMTSDDVAGRAMERLLEVRMIPSGQKVDEPVAVPPSIRAMNCVRGADIERVIPSTRMGPRPEEIVWVVEADGDLRMTNPMGVEIRASRGFLIIDDASGLIVGVGSLVASP